jgi:Chalcone isomerase-like
MVHRLILALAALAPLSGVRAADLDGVAMPDTRVIDGTRMRLNGIGLRTYSVFGVHIYVAGLYLEQPSANPDNILHSRERKLLEIRFLRDVDAEDARKAWQEGFAGNCQPPSCYLDPQDIRRFLSAVPPMHQGDETLLLFTPKGVDVTHNGQPMGSITDPHFAETMLATFIGPAPPTPRLKRELLGERN